MEREILFRGKRIEDGKWVEGFYYKMNETTYVSKEDYEKNPVPTHHYILFERMTDWGMPNQMYQAEVNPKTICQYTGLNDKNGRKIFEGDILKSELGKVGKIAFNESHMAFMILEKTENRYYHVEECSGSHMEVIGNIFDNPELLRGA